MSGFASSLSRALRPVSLRHRRELEQDVLDELAFHQEMRQRDHIKQGMSAAEARSKAHIEDPQGIAETCIRIQSQHPLRASANALVSVFTLSIGFALVASVLLLVNAALFRTPVSFHDDAERIAVWWYDTAAGEYVSGSTVEEFKALRELDDVFDHVTLARYGTATLADDQPPVIVRTKTVSADYFRLYGARPLVGRLFTAEEDRDAHSVILLSHDLWQERYDSDPGIVGRTVELDGQPHRVVGVLPSDLPMFLSTALFVPMNLEAAKRWNDERTLLMAGRLRPGISRELADSRVARHVEGRRLLDPNVGAGVTPAVCSLEEVYSRPVRRTLVGALMIAGVLLTVIFGHVLYRRLALIHQEDTAGDAIPQRRFPRAIGENVLIALAAGWVGVVVASFATPFLIRPWMGEQAPLFDVRPDARVLLGMAVLALAVGTVVGGVVATIRLAHRSGGWCRHPRRVVRFATLVAEVALAVVLVLCAAPPLSAWVRSMSEGPGFDPQRLVLIEATSQPGADDSARLREATAVLAEVRKHPDVEEASFTQAFPAQGLSWNVGFRSVEDPSVVMPEVRFNLVDPEYLGVMRIPLIGGRSFTTLDNANSDQVIVINAAMAGRYWPGADPIGQSIEFLPEGKRLRVIGVAADVDGGAQSAEAPTVYRSFLQYSGARQLTLVLRTSQEAKATGLAIVDDLRARHPDLALGMPVSARSVIRRSSGAPFLAAAWPALLALLAVGLALLDLVGLALSDAERVMRLKAACSLGGLLQAIARPILGVTAAGVAAAGIVAWRLRSFQLPQLRPLEHLDAVTALSVTVGLVVLSTVTIAAAAFYARSIEGDLALSPRPVGRGRYSTVTLLARLRG